MTHRDPIVAEVRKHREAIARELGDVDAIVAALQREEATDGLPSVSFPPKRIAKRGSRTVKKARAATKRARSTARA